MNYYIYYFLIYIVILFPIIFLSKKLKFFDIPNNRKIHKNKILNTSGISFYIYLIFLIYINEYSYLIEKIIFLGFIVLFFGFLDDRKNYSPSTKLIFLTFPILYLVLDGFVLNDLGTYELIGKISLGKFSFVFTLLACLLLINSYNYIDGIDGLAISIFLVGIVYVIFLINDNNLTHFLFLIIIPLIVNMILNFLPSSYYFKMFLGNAGSLFFGFFISFFMIFLYNIKNIHPAYLIWICWYPVYDFLSVTMYRIVNKKKFFEADQHHFHHYFLKKFNGSHKIATLLISLINIATITLGYFTTKFLGEVFSITLFLVLFFLFFYVRIYLNNKQKI